MGHLASTALAQDAVTPIYTCPASKKAVVSVNLAARSNAPSVSLAIVGAGIPPQVPDDADWIEYQLPLTPGGAPLLREGLILAAGDIVFALADAAGVSATVYGLEQDV